MAVRTTMLPLIRRVRELINDLDAAPVFADQETQYALDERKQFIRYEPLKPADTIQPGGRRVWLDYFSEFGFWETDAVIVDASWTPLTADAGVDLLVGKWSFAANKTPPVWAIGQVYDVYGSAADLLEKWAAKVALEFDFASGGRRYARSQKRQALLEMAQEYRAKQAPRTIEMVRDDQNVPHFGLDGNPLFGQQLINR